MAFTITFDNGTDLQNFLASVSSRGDIPAAPAQVITDPYPTPAPVAAPTDGNLWPTGPRINSDTAGDLNIGDDVHWSGAKYTFDGVVENVTDDIGDKDKRVFVRRNDTDKLVSLTNEDLDNYSLFRAA